MRPDGSTLCDALKIGKVKLRLNFNVFSPRHLYLHVQSRSDVGHGGHGRVIDQQPEADGNIVGVSPVHDWDGPIDVEQGLFLAVVEDEGVVLRGQASVARQHRDQVPLARVREPVLELGQALDDELLEGLVLHLGR